MTERDGQLTLALMRIRELEDELAREQRRCRTLAWAFSQLAAGPIHSVSDEQFSMLVEQGPLNG